MITIDFLPMDVKDIKEREKGNDFSTVHLYYNGLLASWIAYDKSAYSLRLLTKMNSCDSYRFYSNDYDMPFTVVSSSVLKKVKLGSLNLKQISKEYILIEDLPPFDSVDFDVWKNRLSEIMNSDDVYHIETPVSQYVPKGKYIKDSMSSFSRNVKRIIDLIASFFALIFFSPVFLFIYILIKLEDGGPAIYKQERIGRFGRPFYIYKFRSMRVDAEKFGPQLSHSGGDNDPRLTKIGKFLRASHLDELPQFWNVFIGDMAFVGPRPERKFYIDQIMEYDRRYKYLYQIRPGVTSYATFYNGYTDTMAKMLRRLEYDLYYLGHRTLWFDFKILIKTFFALVFGKKI